MDVKFKAMPESEIRLVYVRPVAVADLQQTLQDQIGEATTVYAVHGEDGKQLALVADRKLAFALARQHDMEPVNAH